MDFSQLCDPATEYFDMGSLSCTLCSDGETTNNYKVPDMSYKDVYGNALRCKCATGYLKNVVTCSASTLLSGTCIDFTCQDSCATSNNPSYLDNAACTTCGSSTGGYVSSVMDCTCSVAADGYTYEMLTETNIAGVQASEKSCTSCPTGQFVVSANQNEINTAGEVFDVDPYECVSCPDENMQFIAGSCSCTSSYTLTGISSLGKQSCVLTADYDRLKTVYPENLAISMTYMDDTEFSLASIGIQNYYVKAATECYNYRGPQDLPACQTLANLCVLVLYDPTHTICKLFRTIQTSRSAYVNNREGWSNTLPWLYYEESASSIQEDTGIKMSFAFPSRAGPFEQSAFLPATGGTEVHFKLVKWAMNGTYLGVTTLSTELLYCSMPSPFTNEGAGTSDSTKWLQYGYNQRLNYVCDLSSLFSKETFFYDLYLIDESSQSLYPVPVRVRNLLNEDGEEINNNIHPRQTINDEFVRRFFLYDTITGLSTNSPSESEVYEDEAMYVEGGSKVLPVIVRYAKFISIRITSQISSASKIYPPILEIEYDTRLQSEVFDELTPAMCYEDFTFDMLYTMDTTIFWTTIKIFFGMASTAIFIVWAVRMRNWSLRNTRVKDDDYYRNMDMSIFDQIPWIFQCFVLLCHSLVMILFPFTFAICGVWFLFFKLQATTFLLLPEDHLLYKVGNEYFPLILLLNMMFACQLIFVLNMIYRQTTADVFFIDWEKSSVEAGLAAAAAGSTGHFGNKNQSTGPSVWRTINVANKYLDLCIHRKISIEFSLIWITFFLVGLRLENNATAQPNLFDRSNGLINPVLRFANSTFWWLLCALVQRLWRTIIYERYVSEPFEQYFVDLCTLSKISIIIMDETYHGWYLHCRSPYPFADGTMTDILDHLRKEEAGLTSDRSLEGAPKDVQTFEIHVSDIWRQKFDKIYDSLYEYSSFSINNSRARLGAAKRRGQMSARRRENNHFSHTGNETSFTESGSAFITSLFRANKNANVSSEKIAETQSKLTVFLQAFAENHSGKRDLRRTIREPTMLDQILQIPPDIKNGGMGCIFSPDRTYGFLKTMFAGTEYDLFILNVLTFSCSNIWTGNTASAILMTYLLEFTLSKIRRHFGKITLANKTFLDEKFLK